MNVAGDNEAAIRVIHAEQDFLVLDKPAGISVHGGTGVRGRTVADWIAEYYPETKRVGDDPVLRPGIVHRLDRNTSGVMIIARSQEAFENVKRLFKERRVEKTYLALVVGTPKRKVGIIDAPIGRMASNPTKRGVLRPIRLMLRVVSKVEPQAQDKSALRGSRNALTEYRTLERLGSYTLLEVRPKTGRMHQIRVHLASMGTPVAGDNIYGGARARIENLDRQFLHAWRLSFSYPEGRRWQFDAPLPEDLDRILKRLRRLRKRT